MILAAQFAYVSTALGGALALGVLLAARRSVARWPFAAGMALLAAETFCTGQAAAAPTPEGLIAWQLWRNLPIALQPAVWLVFSLSYARGNAREFLRKWRWFLLGALIVPVGLVVGFRDQLVLSLYQVAGGHEWVLRLGWAGSALYLCVLVSAVVVLMNLERTFRASIGTIRWRIKYLLLGVGVLFAVRAYTSSQVLLFRGVDHALDDLNSGALLVAVLLIVRSTFRAGYFDLDVYPSQSVLQNSLTGLLAGIYLLIVGVAAKIVTYLGGDAAFALKAFIILLSLVLLAVLLQSDRLRWQVGRFVSRNFQRPLFDYRTVWRKFIEGTASHVEPLGLSRTLVRLVAEVFQALSVTIWLIDAEQQTLQPTASTVLAETQLRESGLGATQAGAALAFLRLHPEPVDLESAPGDWAAELRRLHPSQFPNGGRRLCLPIVGHGALLGLITLGDRVGGAPFSLQDLDMLKCVADHAAASLLNVQLAQKLLQARELEAFQTMAAFFVHDLKNAASTLNLMLRNLPVHFDDPAFREDALRGIAQTVTHINHLVSRLGLIRHELRIQAVEADFNAMVTRAVDGLKQGLTAVVVRDLQPVPRLPIDAEQMAKVVTNLVLNAAEAVGQPGEVRIGTRQAGNWVVLTVADNGCGMSPQFLERSLFRPFQTTKKNGLGIGMFQSKMIVESHGGRVTVVSELGKGTTFQVHLPLAARPAAPGSAAAPTAPSVPTAT